MINLKSKVNVSYIKLKNLILDILKLRLYTGLFHHHYSLLLLKGKTSGSLKNLRCSSVLVGQRHNIYKSDLYSSGLVLPSVLVAIQQQRRQYGDCQ